MSRALAALLAALAASLAAQEPIRVGVLGLDTSHAVAFTKELNAGDGEGDLARVRVVAAFPGGTDIPASRDRVARFTAEVRALGIEIVDSIPALLGKVDCVLLESVDGRVHVEQARAVFAAKKRVFIDKPLGGSLADVLAIRALGERHGVPWFSSSSLRFGAVMPADVGAVLGCTAWSPCTLEPTHPDLFWYGVHGVESLFTVMGRGCERVVRVATGGADVVTGTWRDGRIGTFRGIRAGRGGYGATVFGSDKIASRGAYQGYAPLCREIARFFVTGVPPVDNEETVELYAFMAAAEASSRRGGVPVTLRSVLDEARAQVTRGPAAGAARPSILFCIADDWSWPHAGCYGDGVVATPAFDEIAAEGVLFTNAFCAAPSCTASRAGILTGQAIHRLAEGGNLHGFLPERFAVYPDLLERAGYAVGFTGKGWGPGRARAGGRARNPAGPRFDDFATFLATVSDDAPFCFWFGSSDPHRPYEPGSGVAAGMEVDQVRVPPIWPDTETVRSDILDYYVEVQRFDGQVADLLAQLAAAGRAENTIVVVTSDNGMPFPRAKANPYDAGTRMPLAIRWPARLRGGHTTPAFTGATDFAPTFLEAAGLPVPADMTGKSLLPLLTTGSLVGRGRVFLERERHANVRTGNLSYPMRALRTERYLYVTNLRPDRWPAGDPELVFAVGPFGDVDDSPTKQLILGERDARPFALAFGKRPGEELYDLAKDPWQTTDVARDRDYADAKQQLRAELRAWQEATGDPRAGEDDDRWDGYPYFGGRARRR